jgi:hypothetical protein
MYNHKLISKAICTKLQQCTTITTPTAPYRNVSGGRLRTAFIDQCRASRRACNKKNPICDECDLRQAALASVGVVCTWTHSDDKNRVLEVREAAARKIQRIAAGQGQLPTSRGTKPVAYGPSEPVYAPQEPVAEGPSGLVYPPGQSGSSGRQSESTSRRRPGEKNTPSDKSTPSSKSKQHKHKRR